MFKTRLLSGIVLVILALVTIISGGTVLWATCLILSLIGLHELYRAVGIETPQNKMLAMAGYIGTAAHYLILERDI